MTHNWANISLLCPGTVPSVIIRMLQLSWQGICLRVNVASTPFSSPVNQSSPMSVTGLNESVAAYSEIIIWHEANRGLWFHSFTFLVIDSEKLLTGTWWVKDGPGYPQSMVNKSQNGSHNSAIEVWPAFLGMYRHIVFFLPYFTHLPEAFRD